MTTTLPERTRAAVLHAAQDLRVEHIPMTGPELGEVPVAIEAVGVCGSEPSGAGTTTCARPGPASARARHRARRVRPGDRA